MLNMEFSFSLWFFMNQATNQARYYFTYLCWGHHPWRGFLISQPVFSSVWDWNTGRLLLPMEMLCNSSRYLGVLPLSLWTSSPNFQAFSVELHVRVSFFPPLFFEWTIDKYTLWDLYTRKIHKKSKDNRYLREGLRWDTMQPTSDCLHYDRGLRGPRRGRGSREDGCLTLKWESSSSPYFYSRASINHLIKGLIFVFGKDLRHSIMHISDLFYSEVSTTAAR